MICGALLSQFSEAKVQGATRISGVRPERHGELFKDTLPKHKPEPCPLPHVGTVSKHAPRFWGVRTDICRI